MKKLENYIYLTICEVSLELFNKTSYTTYSKYCEGMAHSIRDGVLSKRDIKHISKISENLENLYSLGSDENGIYISNYFLDNKCENFEKSVRLTNRIFPSVSKWV